LPQQAFVFERERKFSPNLLPLRSRDTARPVGIAAAAGADESSDGVMRSSANTIISVDICRITFAFFCEIGLLLSVSCNLFVKSV
jgi:hypothetical protein